MLRVPLDLEQCVLEKLTKFANMLSKLSIHVGIVTAKDEPSEVSRNLGVLNGNVRGIELQASQKCDRKNESYMRSPLILPCYCRLQEL